MRSAEVVGVVIVTMACWIGLTEGLKCYVDPRIDDRKETECTGSCVTISVAKYLVSECYPSKQPDGCVKIKGIKYCYCNTDLCNAGNYVMEVTSYLESVLYGDLLEQDRKGLFQMEN